MDIKTKLTAEQERLLNYLKAGAGSRPFISVRGLFSSATIDSLLRRELIKPDLASGYYTNKEGIDEKTK